MISVCPFLCTCDGENSVQVLGKVRLIGLCLVAVTVEGKTLRLAVVDVIVQCNDHLLEFFVICFFVVCSKGIQICHTKDVFQHLSVCDQTISFDVVWDSVVSFTLKLKFQCIRHALIQSLKFRIGNLLHSCRISCGFPFFEGNRVGRKQCRIFLGFQLGTHGLRTFCCSYCKYLHFLACLCFVFISQIIQAVCDL